MLEFFRNDRFVYDTGKGSFRGFLRRIIRARSMDILRKRYRAKRSAALDAKDPDEMFLDSRYDEEWRKFVQEEAMRRLRHAVRPEHFQQFCMLVLQQRSVKEVASFYDVPRSTIYTGFRRTKITLDKIIRNIEENAL